MLSAARRAFRLPSSGAQGAVELEMPGRPAGSATVEGDAGGLAGLAVTAHQRMSATATMQTRIQITFARFMRPSIAESGGEHASGGYRERGKRDASREIYEDVLAYEHGGCGDEAREPPEYRRKSRMGER